MRRFADESYYWAKISSEWFIVEYDAGWKAFFVHGDDGSFPENYFDEIGEEIPRKVTD